MCDLDNVHHENFDQYHSRQRGQYRDLVQRFPSYRKSSIFIEGGSKFSQNHFNRTFQGTSENSTDRKECQDLRRLVE